MPLDDDFCRNFKSLCASFNDKTTMATIGSIGAFDHSEETWASYVERFEFFVDCNSIEDNKKVSTLLTVVGVKTYTLLKDLITPARPSDKTYQEIVDVIGKHLHPTPSFRTER